MTAVKVIYGSVSRRFTIGADTTWAKLESQLRTLFQIPSHAQVIATYTDDDGDNVTLSSDLELAEVHSQSLAGTAIKIVLKTNPTLEETAAALEQISLDDEEPYEAILYSHSETEEAEEQGTCKEICGEACEDITCSADEAHEQGHTEGCSSSDPEIYFFVSRKRSHHGPRRNYSGSVKLESHGGPSECPFTERFRGHHGRGYGRRVHKHGEGGHPHHRGHRFRGHKQHMNKPDRGYGYEIIADKSEKEKEPEMDKSGPSTGEHERHPRHNRKCDKKVRLNSSGDERPRHHCGFGPRIHGHPYFHQRHGHGHHGRHGDHGEIPPEKIAEKLEILNGLSFPAENNAHYEELLKRFHGRIGPVVEAVIREQRKPKEPEDGEPGDDEADSIKTMDYQNSSDGFVLPYSNNLATESYNIASLRTARRRIMAYADNYSLSRTMTNHEINPLSSVSTQNHIYSVDDDSRKSSHTSLASTIAHEVSTLNSDTPLIDSSTSAPDNNNHSSLISPSVRSSRQFTHIHKKRLSRTMQHISSFIKLTVNISPTISFPVTIEKTYTVERLARQIEAEYAFKYGGIEERSIHEPLEVGLLYDVSMVALRFRDLVGDVLEHDCGNDLEYADIDFEFQDFELDLGKDFMLNNYRE
ncbi:14388_t:CDS:2, partial [Racocetra fulgida]